MDQIQTSAELEKALKELKHDVNVILAEFNQHFLNKPASEKVDLDVDRIVSSVKCSGPCCNKDFS
ncbi:hypothetical protein A3B18_00055 [Candidatus Giovannonibacteria bacterium RIFCSPLOWO2_01_FULL_46_13]|uniref:Uncharacterized protein n=1 Tax=Candidatus Giovannonibacteria bacterium RIFCSPLOWO2_01_FULL_46_13 TaxID=1798352 RepID=A0A1F5X370_9BACT|nr:MAG: hypothetical protein A3B18_00055 [Candidatus Giovannonibacteria bacterium RIFCSPLOWO2_01_FULL_46_13]